MHPSPAKLFVGPTTTIEHHPGRSSELFRLDRRGTATFDWFFTVNDEDDCQVAGATGTLHHTYIPIETDPTT